ncbi:hypothetical protein QE330_gp131 [Pseudomonas phage vB_Pae_Kat]|uniref:Uncharacterized protein n=1 Tax=Pseudomonas phage vB_Pae_Kat TaxID=2937408 RepID=A0A9E7DQX4_9CAUD|nr:hypothetical protein QE330_gp131 [Pseudomonas phage vB_Pae_Kat]UQS93475.1 hypothetical protein Kat_gp067 [Pseudomonas phage vB_Pae_Kat]
MHSRRSGLPIVLLCDRDVRMGISTTPSWVEGRKYGEA